MKPQNITLTLSLTKSLSLTITAPVPPGFYPPVERRDKPTSTLAVRVGGLASAALVSISENHSATLCTDLVSTRELIPHLPPLTSAQMTARALRALGYTKLGRARLGSKAHYLWAPMGRFEYISDAQAFVRNWL